MLFTGGLASLPFSFFNWKKLSFWKEIQANWLISYLEYKINRRRLILSFCHMICFRNRLQYVCALLPTCNILSVHYIYIYPRVNVSKLAQVYEIEPILDLTELWSLVYHAGLFAYQKSKTVMLESLTGCRIIPFSFSMIWILFKIMTKVSGMLNFHRSLCLSASFLKVNRCSWLIRSPKWCAKEVLSLMLKLGHWLILLPVALWYVLSKLDLCRCRVRLMQGL